MSWAATASRAEVQARADELAGGAGRVKVLPLAIRAEAAVTVGPYVCIPGHWACWAAKTVLPHEICGHVAQYRICGFGSALAGIPLFGLVYLLLLLPAVFALGRMMLEAHAVWEQWKDDAQQGHNMELITWYDTEHWPKRLWSKSYFWAVPPVISRALFKHIRYKFLDRHLKGEQK